jgi:hypothetical protein
MRGKARSNLPFCMPAKDKSEFDTLGSPEFPHVKHRIFSKPSRQAPALKSRREN